MSVIKDFRNKSISFSKNFSTYSEASSKDKIKKTFNLSENEDIYTSFFCALKKGILLQGKLYVTKNYLCFKSLFKSKIVIKTQDIISAKEAKIPFVKNAIKIRVRANNAQSNAFEDGECLRTSDAQEDLEHSESTKCESRNSKTESLSSGVKEYVFGSFISKKKALKLINHCVAEKNKHKKKIDGQDSRVDIWSKIDMMGEKLLLSKSEVLIQKEQYFEKFWKKSRIDHTINKSDKTFSENWIFDDCLSSGKRKINYNTENEHHRYIDCYNKLDNGFEIKQTIFHEESNSPIYLIWKFTSKKEKNKLKVCYGIIKSENLSELEKERKSVKSKILFAKDVVDQHFNELLKENLIKYNELNEKSTFWNNNTIVLFAIMLGFVYMGMKFKF